MAGVLLASVNPFVAAAVVLFSRSAGRIGEGAPRARPWHRDGWHGLDFDLHRRPRPVRLRCAGGEELSGLHAPLFFAVALAVVHAAERMLRGRRAPRAAG